MPSNSYVSPRYRGDIDGLRGLAVIFVVLFHFYPKIFLGGFVGVDIFFVISGFLITSIIFENLDRSSFSFLEFYLRRVRRIFPALIIVLAACLWRGWYTLLDDEYMSLSKHVAASAGFVQNIILWNESGYFDKTAATKPLLHLWSLGIEEQFYIIWPILIWSLRRSKRTLMIVLGLITLTSFAYGLGVMGRDPVGSFYLPHCRFWELSLGAMGYLLQDQYFKNSKIKFIEWIAALGVLVLVTALFMKNMSLRFPGWRAIFPTFATLFILLANDKGWTNRKFLSCRLLTTFGLISYPLYLWHWPILSFYRIETGSPPNNKTSTLLLVMSVALAFLTWFVVERPIRRVKRLALIWIFAGLLWVVGVLGYSFFIAVGLPARSPLTALLNVSNLRIEERIRMGECFIHQNVGSLQFPDPKKCLDANIKPLLFVWGDSHAAHLYPGLKSLQKELTFGIGQFSANSCPPILDWDNKDRAGCTELNRISFEAIRQSQPAVILLHARWDVIGVPILEQKLASTIQALQSATHSKIVVIGPVPVWKSQLRSFLAREVNEDFSRNQAHKDYEAHKRDRAHKILNSITYNKYLEPQTQEYDVSLRNVSARLGVTYISAFNLFCPTAAGCLTRVPAYENTGIITTYDNCHLSPNASYWLMKQVVPDLLKN